MVEERLKAGDIPFVKQTVMQDGIRVHQVSPITLPPLRTTSDTRRTIAPWLACPARISLIPSMHLNLRYTS